MGALYILHNGFSLIFLTQSSHHFNNRFVYHTQGERRLLFPGFGQITERLQTPYYPRLLSQQLPLFSLWCLWRKGEKIITYFFPTYGFLEGIPSQTQCIYLFLTSYPFWLHPPFTAMNLKSVISPGTQNFLLASEIVCMSCKYLLIFQLIFVCVRSVRTVEASYSTQFAY